MEDFSTPEMAAHAAFHSMPIPYSEAWINGLLDALCDEKNARQRLLDWHLKSFPGLDEDFLYSLENAAKNGDLESYKKAADLGLPMNWLPRVPLNEGDDLKNLIFSPICTAIKGGAKELALELISNPAFTRHSQDFDLWLDVNEKLLSKGYEKVVGAIYGSSKFKDGKLWGLTQEIIKSQDDDVLNAATSVAKTRIYGIKNTDDPEILNAFKFSIEGGYEKFFDACIKNGARPWQIKNKKETATVTAFDDLCKGRDAVLMKWEGTSFDAEDLASRSRMANTLNQVGFGPHVTNSVGGNAADAAAVFRTPDLLEIFLQMDASLNRPRADGSYPLHLLASNLSRNTLPEVLDNLLSVFKKHGSDMDCRDFNGDNPLAFAFSNQFGSVLEAMVRGGVPVLSRNNQNQLMIEHIFDGGAAMSKRGQFIACALRAGFDPKTVLSTGETLIKKMESKGKPWSEAVSTMRAFQARSTAMDLIEEMNDEPSSNLGPRK